MTLGGRTPLGARMHGAEPDCQLNFVMPTCDSQPGVFEGLILQAVVTAGGAAVACRVHLDFQQQRVAVRLHGAQARDVLGGLPVHDLAVVEAGSDQHRRIRPLLQIVVRPDACRPIILANLAQRVTITRMIPRRIESLVRERLSHMPAVALLGPRQVGKTTLAHAIAEGRKSVYLDLESSIPSRAPVGRVS